MYRRKWLVWLVICMMISGMLLGCGKQAAEDAQKQLPQPPTVSREGWQGYSVDGLTVYLPEMFEEGRVFEGNAEFISQDADFDEDYIQLEILSSLEDELQTQVTDEQILVQHIQKQVEDNEGMITAEGTYWDVPYLIYSEFGSEQDYSVAAFYARDGRGWMVTITGMQPDRAMQMVPYVCGGVFEEPAGWDAGENAWMAYSIAGLELRIPGELLEEADFYPDCAYFVENDSGVELEVMSGLLEEFDGAVGDAQTLAAWFARESEADGNVVLIRNVQNDVPYLVCWDGEDAVLTAFYVSGAQYWVVAAENVTEEPKQKWIALVTGARLADGL